MVWEMKQNKADVSYLPIVLSFCLSEKRRYENYVQFVVIVSWSPFALLRETAEINSKVKMCLNILSLPLSEAWNIVFLYWFTDPYQSFQHHGLRKPRKKGRGRGLVGVIDAT
jgi:hypothetical protein